VVICLEQGANGLHYGLADATATLTILFQKIQNGLSFWYQPTRVILERRPLNDLLLLLLLNGLAEAVACVSV